MRKTKKDRGGFTLLELLMVVIIIAILASIALPQYLRTAERARASEALQVLGAIRTSEMRYKAFSPTNVFSDDINELDVDIPGWGIPASNLWTYGTVPAAGATHAEATRNAGGAILQINLTTGKACTDDAVYGVFVGLVC